MIYQTPKKKPEDRGKKRVPESSEETTSRKNRGASVSSVEEPKENKRERKEEKAKNGFDKGLKAEKIIGIVYLLFSPSMFIKYLIYFKSK